MRYLIKFTKESNIKFISHLDLMRTLQRVIKRAALPVEYSQGFNPHMSVSITQPLSVGMYSCGEYMDVFLKEELDEDCIKNRLNENSPSGIKFIAAVKIREAKEGCKKVPQSMAALDAAKYKIKIKYNDTSNLEKDIRSLINLKEWNTIKKSKKGEREVNIKPMVKEFRYRIEENLLIIDSFVCSGSRKNLSADLLAEFIKKNTSNVIEDSFIDIQRQEMYGFNNKKYLPLYDLLGNWS